MLAQAFRNHPDFQRATPGQAALLERQAGVLVPPVSRDRVRAGRRMIEVQVGRSRVPSHFLQRAVKQPELMTAKGVAA